MYFSFVQIENTVVFWKAFYEVLIYLMHVCTVLYIKMDVQRIIIIYLRAIAFLVYVCPVTII